VWIKDRQFLFEEGRRRWESAAIKNDLTFSKKDSLGKKVSNLQTYEKISLENIDSGKMAGTFDHMYLIELSKCLSFQVGNPIYQNCIFWFFYELKNFCFS